MILLLGGTIEGKQLAVRLKEMGYSFTATVVTDYGKELAAQAAPDLDCVIRGTQDEKSLEKLIVENKISAVIDATHPFAVEASLNAREAAVKRNVEYIRFERPSLDMPACPLIHKVCGFPEAAAEAVKHGEVIFVAIGVNHLKPFVQAATAAEKQLVVRVLPVYFSLKKCSEMGLTPSQIIAVQGVGSLELNKILLKEFRASLLVTKDSGDAGGTGNKIRAALELNLPVVLIERPSVNFDYGNKVFKSIEEIVRYISQKYDV